MNIPAASPIGVPPGTATATEASGASELTSQNPGKDEFLRLLVAQLSNQDPMDPLKGQEFAAQLAQFSSVEQLVGINQALEQQMEMSGLLAQGVNSSVAAGLIGKTVEAEGNAITWRDSGDVLLRFEQATASAGTVVEVRDEAGNLVRTFDRNSLRAGMHEVTWDGKDNDGNRVPKGNYTFQVNAAGAEGEPVGARTFLRGKVDRIQFGQGGIILWVGERSIPISAVHSVEEGL